MAGKWEYADAAHERVRSRYLAPHYLANYLELVTEISERDDPDRPFVSAP